MTLSTSIAYRFFNTQYHLVPPVEKDSYVIKDVYVEINCLSPVNYLSTILSW
jgi:hypothetical protein